MQLLKGEVRPAWIRACVRGELVGFIPPAITGTLLVWLDASEAVLVAGLVVAGCAEGAILGAFQSTVMRRVFPTVNGWTRATSIAAGLAWLAGMGGSSVVQATGLTSLLLVIPAWIGGLLAMGVLQSQRLAVATPYPSSWIAPTTAAWLIGVMIPVVALSVVPNEAQLVIHIVVAIVAAAAMGATVGALTGTALNRLAERTSRWSEDIARP